jgi:hypothetical protein
MALVAAAVHKLAALRAPVAPALDLVATAPQVVVVQPTAEPVEVVVLAHRPVVQEVQVLWSWPTQNHRNSQVVPFPTWVAQWYTHLQVQVI